MSTTKPDLTRIWASDAPPANVVDPDSVDPGKYEDGWVAEIPPFEYMNYLQQLFNQGLVYINEQGIGLYDNVTDFPISGICKGSDSNTYIALIANGPDTSVVDPVGDTTGTWGPLRLLEELLSSTLTHNMTSDLDYILSVSENYKGRVIITDTSVNLTTTRNIVVADTERTFFAQNDTAQTLTFKTVAGVGIAVAAGKEALLLCDGTNVIDPVPTAGTTNTLAITSSGTYDKPPGLKSAEVIVIGAGAAGGGVDGQGSGTWAAGAGGGAGEYREGSFLASELGATETVTIGAGGVGVSAGTGGAGGNTSFGALITSNGGLGGVAKTGATTQGFASGGDGGSGGSGGDIAYNGNVGGMSAQSGASTSQSKGGDGASTSYGGAPRGPQGDSAGNDASGNGAGGSGAVSTGTTDNYAGGDGADGIAIIKEHF